MWVNYQKTYEIIAEAPLFMLARLPEEGGEDIVGLFIEDDETYHLQCKFSSYWLPALKTLADKATKTMGV